MQQIQRWRNVLTLRRNSPSSDCASFHSTPPSLAKWKSKWNQFDDAERGQQPSKNYIRYQTRQKRADAKRALGDILFKKLPFQVVGPKMNTAHPTSSWDFEQADGSNGSHKRSRSKNSSCKARAQQQSSHSRKGKPRRENFYGDFDEQSERVFQGTFGGRCYTWSYRSWDDSHPQSSSPEFEWRDRGSWASNRRKGWDCSSETDDDNESCDVGSCSHRKLLGLPVTGPLKIEDVKSAFRSSALKWHPDKHEGASQAMAEEKFKLCVDAYKSLCNVLSPA